MTWTARSSPMSGPSGYVNDAAVSSSGIVVAVGAQDPSGSFPQPLIMRSTDGGVTWAEASSYPYNQPSVQNFISVTWCEFLGLFFCCGYKTSSTSTVTTSPDGDVWTTIYSNNANISLVKAVSCESLGIVSIVGTDFLGADSGTVLTTTNGVATTLHTGTVAMKYPWRGAWSDAEGVAVIAGRGPGPADAINRTTDGINYTGVSSALGGGTSFQFFANYMPGSAAWVVSGENGSAVNTTVVSFDSGLTWSPASLTDDNKDAAGELLDGSILVANCPDGSRSTDGGLTWAGSPMIPSGCASTAVVSLPTFDTNVVVGCVANASDDVVMTGTATRIVPPPGPGGVGGVGGSPLWKYFVAALDGTGISDYSKLARDRACEVILNGPLLLRGGAPSDNPQVNIVYTDDGYNDPYLNEGTRLLWGFRRESDTSPYYVVRAATIINLVQDAAEQDDAVSSFTGWDPWHYMFSRPVCNADGTLPTKNQKLSFSNTQASVVIATLLRNTIDNQGFAFIDAGTTYSGSSEYAGTLETGAGMEINIEFPIGTTVGQAWQMVTDLGVCDIILSPIYVPAGRTVGVDTVYNFLVELNVYAQAGSVHDELIFAWNLPGRSLVGIDRQFDGSSRVNEAVYYAGQGGQYGKSVKVEDLDSVVKFGESWEMQAFPSVVGRAAVAAVTSLAEEEVALRNSGRETVTFRPAPERSPRPWQDYNLGDRVPVWASREAFRDVLGEEQLVGSTTQTQYQRIYGWTANISDDAMETIDPLLVSPETAT